MNNYKFKKNKLSKFFSLLTFSRYGSALFGLGSALAMAQPQPQSADTLEEVLVTGIRASLSQVLDTKRESISLVDAIVAEDIGRMPDANMAESLQRVPGVYLTRDGASNEGSRITIRGLGSQFAVTTLNGAPVHTTSSGNIGSSTRDFNYDVFPSELFGKVTIYKSPLAPLPEGGIGGVVNLETPRPFDSGERVVRFAASAFYNDSSEKTGPRLSGLYSNTWGNFGALLGVAHAATVNTRSGYQSTGGFNRSALGALYPETQGPFDFALDLDNPNANYSQFSREQVNNAFLPRFHRAYASENDRDRSSLVAALQYQNDKLDVSLDVLTAKLDNARDEFTFGIAIRSSGTRVGTGLVPLDPFIDENNNLQGRFSNAPLLSESVFEDTETTFYSVNLRSEYDLSDNVIVKAQLTSSRSEAELLRNRMLAEVREGVTLDIGFDDPTYPSLVILDRDFSDPQSYTRTDRDFSQRNEDDSDDMFKVELDWHYNLGQWSGTLTSGFMHVESTKTSQRRNGNAIFDEQTLPNGLTWNTMNVSERLAVMDTSLSISPYADDAGDDFPKNWANWSRATVDNFWQPTRATRSSPVDFGASFEAVEAVDSLYIQSEISGEVFQRTLRANVGLRHSKTAVDIENFVLVEGAYEPRRGSESYSNTLPSLSAAYDLRDDLVLRASWGQTITRAGLTDIAGSLVIPNVFNPNATQGNPALRPMTSTQWDTSLEWYFAESALLSVGVFEKKLKDTTENIDVIVPWQDLNLPDSALGSNQQDENGNVDSELPITLSTKVNSGEQNYSGVELAWQQNFSFLPGLLANTGVQASYTRVDTDGLEWVARSGRAYEVWNVPKFGSSVTAFYEDDKTAFRVSYSGNGKSIVESNNNPQRDLQRWQSQAYFLDATFSYKITDSIEIRLDGTNLSDEISYQYFPDPDGVYSGGRSRREQSLDNGRTFTLGVRCAF